MSTNHLTWTASTAGTLPIAGYHIYDSDTGALLTSTASLSFDDVDVADGTYNYIVKAYDSKGNESVASNEITLTISPPGLLIPLSPDSISTGSSPTDMIVTPDGLNAYVVTGNLIYQYSISSGLLTPLSPTTISKGNGSNGIAISPDGAYLYAPNSSDNNTSQFSISSGLLTPLSPATVATGKTGGIPRVAICSPDGSYAYVASAASGSGAVSQYSISSGLLSPLSPATVSVGTDVTAIAITPDGSYLYVAASNVIYQFSISSGLLTPLSPATIFAGSTPIAIAISPDGLYAYVATEGLSTIAQFSIRSDGQLIALSPATVASLNYPWAIATDGSHLYASSVSDNGLSQYSISSGLLTPLSPATVSITGSFKISVVPGGPYVLVLSQYGNVYQFTR